jgi:ParB family chromosome partitioning protein
MVASALSEQLDTTVKVTMGRKKGRVTMEFADLEDLERILAALG